MDLKNPRQNPANFSHNQNCADVSTKNVNKKKWLRIFGAGGLAFFMGAGVLFGTLLAPMGAISAFNSGDPAALAQSADNAQNLATLNLNPAIDETIYTTENGIEIKSHKLTASGTATSLQYFTLGSYNGTPVNWLIVGVSSNGIGTDSTPAGTAIKADSANQKLVTSTVSSDLLENQILCVSQYALAEEEYNPNFVAHSAASGCANDCTATTNELSDYYSVINNDIPNIDLNSLTLGTTLGINMYYGSDSGKIIVNSTFSDNHVFSLNTTQYTSFLNETIYNVPYLLSDNTMPIDIWTRNASLYGAVTSQFYTNTTGAGSFYQIMVAGNGAKLVANINNVVNKSGEIGINSESIADFSATYSNSGSYYRHSYWGGSKQINNDYYYFTTYYSVINYTVSIAYRPAFVMQL